MYCRLPDTLFAGPCKDGLSRAPTVAVRRVCVGLGRGARVELAQIHARTNTHVRHTRMYTQLAANSARFA